MSVSDQFATTQDVVPGALLKDKIWTETSGYGLSDWCNIFVEPFKLLEILFNLTVDLEITFITWRDVLSPNLSFQAEIGMCTIHNYVNFLDNRLISA